MDKEDMASRGHSGPTLKRPRLVVRGIASAGALGLVLVGLPIELWHQGLVLHPNTASTLIHHPLVMFDRFRSGSEGAIVSEIAASLAWSAWLYLLLCSAGAATSAITGRVPRRLPGAQMLRFLMAGTATAVLAIAGSKAKTGDTLRLQPVAVGALVNAPVETGPETRSQKSPLGNAQGEVGSPVAGGRTSYIGPTELTSDSPAGHRQYVVQPGDTLWSVAETQLASPLRWREVASANRGHAQVDGRSLGDDNWIVPGWILRLPIDMEQPIREPVSDKVVATETAHFESLAVDSMPGPMTWLPEQVVTVTGRASDPSTPVESMGYGLLGGAVAILLDRMRRAQTRRRPPGHRISLPDGRLRELERDLRASDRSIWIAMNELIGLLRDRGGPLAVRSLEVISIGPTGASVWTEESLPAPFERREPDGKWFVASEALRHFGSACSATSNCVGDDVALVSVGADGEGAIVLNLLGVRTLSIVGVEATPLVEGIVAELATTSWGGARRILVVGHPGSLGAFVGVEQVDSSDDAVRKIRSDGRCPDIVVCFPGDSVTDPGSTDQLLDLARHGHTAVVLGAERAGDAPFTRWSVASGGDSVALDGPRVDIHTSPPTTLTVSSLPARRNGLLDDVHVLAVEATDDGGVAFTERDVGAGEPTMIDGGHGGVTVRLLGPVDVIGLARPFARAWSLELVAFLSTRPRGASTDVWAAALWPDRLMAAASLHSTASDARRALGVAPSGEDHLPKGHGRLTLGATVTSDWEQFQKLAANDDPESRRLALALVRGRPLDGLRNSDWALLDGIVALIEACVVDLASRHAEFCLDHNDPREAAWSARQALLMSPYDERLYRILMRSADANGHPAGVESAMNELTTLIGEVEPFDAVHPETLRLYETLSRHRTAAADR